MKKCEACSHSVALKDKTVCRFYGIVQVKMCNASGIMVSVGVPEPALSDKDMEPVLVETI